ncbi:type IV conjugative transfer system lipoprotein TraV [Candidatus Pantoea multigeneris]|uniref:Type IV conjugative transfer system lipoprotein TraV n=1 Tax=Candidatus Pantoea multigeneris TaxID=2608357 RepID=A0ABX0REX2_9GAMM|nr:type IV conjugative transfer system lipoprotein TraV [Pantoea multigeneris]NIF23916.1 type IV conjugative transfer system lipoprotein TraV [Pantoea multigeneris]
MHKPQAFIAVALAALLSGCAGMNSDFQFDKPARDSGVWMSQADDMSAGNSTNAPSGAGAPGVTGSINLSDYRLIDTGNIALAPQGDVRGSTGQGEIDAGGVPLRVAQGGSVRPFTRENDRLYPAGNNAAYCNAAHCFPEPTAAFRRPDGVARIWIAPYVSPDDNVHMGEVIYSVASPTRWNGILM